MQPAKTMSSLSRRLGKSGILIAGVGAAALASAAAVAVAYYYDDNGSLFRNTPKAGKFYDPTVSATAISGAKLYMARADTPAADTTQTFYFDAATSTYKGTTTLALSGFDCSAPSSMGAEAGNVVVCEPKNLGAGPGNGSGGDGSNVFGDNVAWFSDPYGSSWNLTNPAVVRGSATLASGAGVQVQTTQSSPRVVAYSINIPNEAAAGTDLTLTNVFFGCRPDLGSYSSCDGLMSFEYDTTADQWRLVALVDARTKKTYVDEYAANNDFSASTHATIAEEVRYVVPGVPTPFRFPVTKVANMGITMAAVLAYWDWSKY